MNVQFTHCILLIRKRVVVPLHIPCLIEFLDSWITKNVWFIGLAGILPPGTAVANLTFWLAKWNVLHIALCVKKGKNHRKLQCPSKAIWPEFQMSFPYLISSACMLPPAPQLQPTLLCLALFLILWLPTGFTLTCTSDYCVDSDSISSCSHSYNLCLAAFCNLACICLWFRLYPRLPVPT